MTKLKDRLFDNINILSGKYVRKNISNIEMIQNKNLKIKDVNSKGKLLWIELENKLFLTSHLGMSGFWSFHKNNNDRIRILIKNKNNDKTYDLCYQDQRNFGNIEILTEQNFKTKIDSLADDVLKTEFDGKEFEEKIKKYIQVSKSRKDQNIFKVLTNQNKNDGIVSGLGNYLTPEILYDCKISPFRPIGSLNELEIKNLLQSIKYIVKLSYFNNTTGYMTQFNDFIDTHKQKILDGIFPNFHPEIKLKPTDKFSFKVYQLKNDYLGNKVDADKSLQKDRTTYWVPNVQK